MEVTILIAPDGRLVLAVENQGGLTFEQVKTRLTQLKTQLLSEGMQVVFDDKVEQHIHGPEGRHVSGDVSHFNRPHFH